MARQYIKASIEELEKLVADNQNRLQVLGDIRAELTYRETPRAKQLLREVEALLGGQVKMPPKPAPKDSTDNQLDMLDE